MTLLKRSLRSKSPARRWFIERAEAYRVLGVFVGFGVILLASNLFLLTMIGAQFQLTNRAGSTAAADTDLTGLVYIHKTVLGSKVHKTGSWPYLDDQAWGDVPSISFSQTTVQAFMLFKILRLLTPIFMGIAGLLVVVVIMWYKISAWFACSAEKTFKSLDLPGLRRTILVWLIFLLNASFSLALKLYLERARKGMQAAYDKQSDAVTVKITDTYSIYLWICLVISNVTLLALAVHFLCSKKGKNLCGWCEPTIHPRDSRHMDFTNGCNQMPVQATQPSAWPGPVDADADAPVTDHPAPPMSGPSEPTAVRAKKTHMHNGDTLRGKSGKLSTKTSRRLALESPTDESDFDNDFQHARAM